MRRARTAALLLPVLALVAPPMRAQTCPEDSVAFGSQAFSDLVDQILSRNGAIEASPAGVAAATDLALNAPLESPSAEKISAPSATGTTPDLVDGPILPTLLGIAVDNGLVETKDNVTTLSLNLFAFKSMVDPSVVDLQSKYEAHSRMRRFGGSASFGGSGESFDRDGDGTADPALEAEELDDIVNWDVQYRFAGSRDRRDRVNYTKVFKAVDSSFKANADAHGAIVSGTVQTFAAQVAGAGSLCVKREAVEKHITTAHARELKLFTESDAKMRETYTRELERIDGSAVWTLVVGGTSRRPEFGPDKAYIAVRGAGGLGEEKESGWLVNVEWNRTRGLAGAPDPSMLKGAAEYSRFLLKGRYGFKDGIKFSASGAFELWDDVPGAVHENIGKLNAKLNIPIRDGIALPISVTWADHKDLLTDESDVRGHIGFTFDLSPGALLKPPASDKAAETP